MKLVVFGMFDLFRFAVYQNSCALYSVAVSRTLPLAEATNSYVTCVRFSKLSLPQPNVLREQRSAKPASEAEDDVPVDTKCRSVVTLINRIQDVETLLRED